MNNYVFNVFGVALFFTLTLVLVKLKLGNYIPILFLVIFVCAIVADLIMVRKNRDR